MQQVCVNDKNWKPTENQMDSKLGPKIDARSDAGRKRRTTIPPTPCAIQQPFYLRRLQGRLFDDMLQIF